MERYETMLDPMPWCAYYRYHEEASRRITDYDLKFMEPGLEDKADLKRVDMLGPQLTLVAKYQGGRNPYRVPRQIHFRDNPSLESYGVLAVLLENPIRVGLEWVSYGPDSTMLGMWSLEY
ncbi:hypothetical protein BHM03_00045350 [Ensete ventricosum]|nr:hypothetical protein BHM03_00045350 [Ensete ventricosum]